MVMISSLDPIAGLMAVMTARLLFRPSSLTKLLAAMARITMEKKEPKRTDALVLKSLA